MFLRQTAAFARHKHTWISLRAPCAKRHVPAKRLLRSDSHAVSTLGSLSVRKHTCSCDRLLRPHAVTALVSHSVRKEACSGEKTAAFSRREHTGISLRAQRDMFHRKDCCDLELRSMIDDFYLRTPDSVSTIKRAHVPYAMRNP